MSASTELRVKARRAGTLVDEITGKLRRRILNGQFAPGMRLVELELAAQTGGSQGSVREALQRLERDGLVVRQGRRGTFVTEISLEDLHEIFMVRSVVESAAVQRLCSTIRSEQLDELRSLHLRMREAGEAADAVALVENDMAFHRRICTWANHPTLLQTWTLLCTQIERSLVQYDTKHFPDLRDVADLHLPILDALAQRDPAQAADRLKYHVMIGAPPAASGPVG